MPVTPDGVALLVEDPLFLRGFSAGTIYTALAQQSPFVCGLVARIDDEQMLVFGSRFGYDVTRRVMDKDFIEVTFRLRN